ncbi:MAG TPA: carboxypeptidase regulatory-like domain-containing protein [Gemmatimonadaceae bacterium]|nr:carboxypeptidase regulatory-like domain-containing protein [Gemmatimonadaceae bacterium]
MTPRCRAALLLLAGTAVGLPAQHAALAGRVVSSGTSVSLGYSVVGTSPEQREEFTDAKGQFVLHDLPAGRIRFTAKHIGYVPFDTTLDLRANDSLQLDVALSLITIELPAIRTVAAGCLHPGAPNPQYGAALANLFEQLQENAERNRLLAHSYPFELTIERRITKPEPMLQARFVAIDTIERGSTRDWHYAPGKLLGKRHIDEGVFSGNWTTIILPELADFADLHFLESHCFDYAGLDELDGDTLIRIDFVPAPTVRTPDIGGAIFLDRKTYQLRSTMVSLTNLTKDLQRRMSGQSIRADFREVLPGVPVIDRVSSMVYPRTDVKPVDEPATETQRTLTVRFLRGRP